MISTTLVTKGTSPKAIFAAVAPALGGLVAVIVQWIATGALDRGELATAVGAVLASALAFAGAYAAEPGEVVPANTSTSARSSWGRGERGLADPLTLLVQVLVVVIVVVLAVWLIRELL